MKVAFYLDNKGCLGVDFSKPQLGNPGVGGTEYMFSAISYLLSKKKEYEVLFFTTIENVFSYNIKNIIVKSFNDAIIISEKENVDYLVIRTTNKKETYEIINNANIKVIVWGHNFAKFKELNWIANCKNVYRYVCVGKNQLSLLDGHKVYKKSTYIYNCLFNDIYNVDTKNKKKSICYVGSIIKTKGFDVCCRIWRKLYNLGYDIDLNVIGSGSLYNKNVKLGKYGIAKEDFENEFMKYLVDDNNNLISNVHLFGTLGHDRKVDVINSSYIGIPNPSGETETFGISAVEFESLGVPVVTKNACGFRDTVKNGNTGFLCKDEDEMVDKCIELLNNNKLYEKMHKNGIDYSRIFNSEDTIQRWDDLFNNVDSNQLKSIGIFLKIKNLINLILYRQV